MKYWVVYEFNGKLDAMEYEPELTELAVYSLGGMVKGHVNAKSKTLAIDWVYEHERMKNK